MSIFYRSQRVGKNGKVFDMLKFKTLKDGVEGYAHQREYVFMGRFMRAWRIDELPQLWNMLKGDMAIFGPRPRDPHEVFVYPKEIRDKLLSVKPGLFSLAGIFFIDEEHILKFSNNTDKDYFERILPIKLALDMFFIENRCILLYIALVYMALRARILNK